MLVNNLFLTNKIRNLLRCFTVLSCILLVFTGCTSYKTIVNGVDEREANEILVFLSSRNITALKVPSKEGTGPGAQRGLQLYDITVSNANATEALSLLNQVGLPRRKGQNLLNIFKDVGLVPSEMGEKIRYQSGLAEQIASTIRKIDGVIDAEVQLSIPEENPLEPSEKRQKVAASVYVKHNGVLDDPNSHLITKIKRLVAASVPNLDYDNVTVIPDRARFSEVPGGTSSAGEEEKQFVSVWSIIVAKDSVTRFRIIFFTFIFLLLSALLILVWIGWKIYPVLEKQGGIRELFHLHPLVGQDKSKEGESETKEGEEEKKDDQDKDAGVT